LRETILNIPNCLTLFRVLSIPIFLMLWLFDFKDHSMILMILGFLSDFFDGRVARALSQETRFGAIFDPIADKISTLFYIPFFAWLGDLPEWYMVIVVVRNFAQLLSIPILVWWLKRPFYVKPKLFAKWGSALPEVLLVSFVVLRFFPTLDFFPSFVLLAVILISSIFEIIILVTYVPRLIQIALGSHDTFE